MSLKNFIINKNIKRSIRKTQFHNFDTAKNISLLYSIKSEDDFSAVKKFAEDLKNKGFQINTLAFVLKPEEIGNKYFGQNNDNFFSEKHISKFGNIKETCIKDFVNGKTDILINLCHKKYFCTEYIFAISKAEFKVSGIIGCKYSDLNINLSEAKDIHFLIEQITYYLSVIKKA